MRIANYCASACYNLGLPEADNYIVLANPSIRPSVLLSVRHIQVLYLNECTIVKLFLSLKA